MRQLSDTGKISLPSENTVHTPLQSKNTNVSTATWNLTPLYKPYPRTAKQSNEKNNGAPVSSDDEDSSSISKINNLEPHFPQWKGMLSDLKINEQLEEYDQDETLEYADIQEFSARKD